MAAHAMPCTAFVVVRCVGQCVQVNRARQLRGVVFARPTDTVHYMDGAPQPHLHSVRPGQQELALHFEEALSSFIGELADDGGATRAVPDNEKAS